VAIARCEKLVVATSEDQHAKLAGIRETAARNGVTDLVLLTGAEARALEPEVRCTAALLSPSTGIVDSHGLMLALQGEAEAHGAQVVLQSPVDNLEAVGESLFAVTVGGETATTLTCRNLVLSAGLGATHLAKMLRYPNGYSPPETYFAKGQYYALSGASPFKRHIYPMPQGAWLGLHATVDIGGRCKFGPDIAWIPEIDYTFEPEKLAQFLDFIRSYYPGLDVDRLHPDYTGIRPKIYREGEPVPDFAFHGSERHGHKGLMMLFGIESRASRRPWRSASTWPD
jgi:L-2-hydroxyglutarate oxidase LhgO